MMFCAPKAVWDRVFSLRHIAHKGEKVAIGKYMQAIRVSSKDVKLYALKALLGGFACTQMGWKLFAKKTRAHMPAVPVVPVDVGEGEGPGKGKGKGKKGKGKGIGGAKGKAAGKGKDKDEPVPAAPVAPDPAPVPVPPAGPDAAVGAIVPAAPGDPIVPGVIVDARMPLDPNPTGREAAHASQLSTRYQNMAHRAIVSYADPMNYYKQQQISLILGHAEKWNSDQQIRLKGPDATIPWEIEMMKGEMFKHQRLMVYQVIGHIQ